MNPGNPFANNSQTNQRVQSFLESLKNRPVASPAEGVGPYGNMESFMERQRLEEQRKQEFFRERQREFSEVYSRSKKQQEQKIIQIQERLQQLAKSVEKFNRQVVTTVAQEVVEPSIYHETFFDHIMNLINLLQKKVNDSNNWLAMYSSRSKKKSFYWAMAGKGGTKYTQALDRGVATSVG